LKKAKPASSEQEQQTPTQASDQDTKENQSKTLKPRKSVRFSSAKVDDDGDSWQNQEIKKLEARITELLV
jgi:hypothetical protein